MHFGATWRIPLNDPRAASCHVISRKDASPPHTDRAIVFARWRRGLMVSVFRRMNKVTLRRARLVLGWVTVFVRVYHLGM